MFDRNVHQGPNFHTPVSTDSLGIQLYNSFVNNAKKTAMVDAISGEIVTYQKFLEVTCRLAQAFERIGLTKEDVISICSENSCSFFYPVIAAFYNGIMVAPINFNYISTELLHVLSISKPKVFFCSKSSVKKCVEAKARCQWMKRIIVLDDSDEKYEGAESLKQFLDENSDKYLDEYSFRPKVLDPLTHPACILCSSGTTGLPKGVVLSHNNISIRICHTVDPRYENCRPGITQLGFLPFFHGYGFITILSCLAIGQKVVMLNRFEEKHFLKTIQDHKIDSLMLVPPILLFLSKTPLLDNYDLSCVQEITTGAAPLGKEIEQDVKGRFKVSRVRQAYGLTESTLAVLMMPRADSKNGSVGKPVPGMSLRVVDRESGKSVGPNKAGELQVKGGMVMMGYYGNPAATAQTFTEDGWLLTGDVCYYDDEGYFYVVDRLKELIKYKGFQVAPAELEAILLTHPKILDAAVIGLPDEKAGELPLAFVVKQHGVHVTDEEIKTFIAKQVSHPKRLHGGVRFVEKIPKNPSGKILRRELRETLKQTTKSKL